MDRLLRRWLPVLLVVVALSVAGVAAAGGTGLSGGEFAPPEEEIERAPEQPRPGATDSPPPDRPGEERGTSTLGLPGWLSQALTVLLLGASLAVVGLLLYLAVRYLLIERVNRRALRDRAASQPPGGVDPEAVRDAVRASLADIAAGGDARRAVIACWLRLERLAAAAGTARLAADTPGDLVARLLSAHRVGDQALERLADAYRLARYAPGEVGGELVATAREALSEVDAQMAAGVEAPRGAGAHR